MDAETLLWLGCLMAVAMTAANVFSGMVDEVTSFGRSLRWLTLVALVVVGVMFLTTPPVEVRKLVGAGSGGSRSCVRELEVRCPQTH